MSRRIVKFFLLGIAPALAIFLALLGVETLRTNLLGWFLFLTGVVYTAGIVIVAHIRKEKIWESRLNGEITQEESSNRSFWLITTAMMVVFYLSPLEYLYIKPFLPRTNWMEFSGGALVVMGSILFLWTRRTLGLNYSGQIAAIQGQILIKHGPYRYIRHPAYAAYLLMTLGISIGYASLWGLTACLVLLLPSIFYRIQVEEKILYQHFGEAYQDYAKVTKRLIPGLL